MLMSSELPGSELRPHREKAICSARRSNFLPVRLLFADFIILHCSLHLVECSGWTSSNLPAKKFFIRRHLVLCLPEICPEHPQWSIFTQTGRAISSDSVSSDLTAMRSELTGWKLKADKG